MNKILTIAKREFAETVKTKAFLFGVVVMPLLIVGIIFATKWLSEKTEAQFMPPRVILIADETGAVFAKFAANLETYNQQNPGHVFEARPVPGATQESLARQVRDNEAYAFIRIPAEVIAGEGRCQLGRKDNQLTAGQTIERALDKAIVSARFQAQDPPIDEPLIRRLERDVPIDDVDVATGKAGVGDEMARIMTPFIFMFLIYMGTFGISMGLLTSVLEEKSSRVVEVLLAAVSPMQLMAGKIIGMVVVGLLVLAMWGGVGFLGARSYNLSNVVTGMRLFWVAMFFIPGFLFSSALLAALGSVCNTLKEAQSLSSPLTIINIVPLMMWFPLSQNPGGTLAVVLSMIPPISPFVMIMRICADADTPVWQIVLSLAILWAAVIAMMWAAGKVFRVGVLMYGKAPSPRELIRWLRYA